MKIHFTKMHGLGNDFIVLDCRTKAIPKIARAITRLGHRRFGVGFDQALVLMKSKVADFRMDIYNSDGSRVEMCGNGIRCIANYIWSHGLSKKKRLEIETLAGIIRPERAGNLVRVDMGPPVLDGALIPTTLSGAVIDHPLKSAGRIFKATAVSMGNPHCVVFVEDAEACPVALYGPELETNPIFPRKANVEFVEVVNRKTLRMRVWERGSGETMACGTGACASAVAAGIKGLAQNKVRVILDGGPLDIEVAKDGRVYMTGPAEEVFAGVAEI